LAIREAFAGPERLYTAAVKGVGAILACGLSATMAAEPAQTRGSFAEWLDGVRSEALSRGIRQGVVDQALGSIEEPLPVVLERDRLQAEKVLPLEAYLSQRLTPKMVQAGRDMIARHKPTLGEVSGRYGVPSALIAGIWGIESNFGRFSGVRPTVAALATLAWDPRRANFFRGELFDALEILNRGDIEFASMRGSWAGAMGQPQFLPSSYLKYAEDFDGDGRRDIWNSPGDVFASIANYLKGHGWTPGVAWGREVTVTPEAVQRIGARVAQREGSCQATREMTAALPLGEWQRLGVRTVSGGPLPSGGMSASLVSGTTRHFLVSSNYDALLEYNCAHAYALSVALLGDRLSTSGAKANKAATTSDRQPSSRNGTLTRHR
jgi:membrane-bound lytic murein transglycosylase B